jgi:hypothetical protein
LENLAGFHDVSREKDANGVPAYEAIVLIA